MFFVEIYFAKCMQEEFILAYLIMGLKIFYVIELFLIARILIKYSKPLPMFKMLHIDIPL